MSKTNQPLTILVHEDWLNDPAVAELVAAGHTVAPAPDVDLILHPGAHWWAVGMFKSAVYIATALAGARRRKREGKDGH